MKRAVLLASLLVTSVACGAESTTAPKKVAVADKPAAKAPAEEKTEAESTDYVRFVEEDEGDALETAVVRFESPQKVVVDLVGAIHIADKSYYDALNTRFRGYEAVLYELVGPPMHQREKGKMVEGGEGLQWVGTMQAKMRDTLKLEGQLASIDYSAKNFVHADMSWKQFEKTREKKQESFLKLYLKLWQAQTAAGQDSAQSDAAALAMLFNMLTKKDTSMELKRGLASQMDAVEALMGGVEAGEGTVIVGERNRVAFEVLDKQIAAGKKNLAIFYGAAHLPDMEKRLYARGFKRVKEEWLRAWWMPYE
ncbi:MAG: hypothetical protein JNG86_00345 [Verrucomicrobiaceae bacterium]|nr:hypothetical protein [Verrucomicrobiaceae bacterium]